MESEVGCWSGHDLVNGGETGMGAMGVAGLAQVLLWHRV